MIKLSKPSKMPCPTWSLQAWDTCPGSRNLDGSAVDACKICYATQGFYHMPDAKKIRAFNKEDWKRSDWVYDMIQAIGDNKYFRWFDSGDIYSYDLAVKIWKVVRNTPDTQHWIPTRAYKDPAIRIVLMNIASLPNACVRLSSDSIMGERVSLDGFNDSSILPDYGDKEGKNICMAYTRGGKCGDCRDCWNKDIQTIFYVAHGQRAKKVYRQLEV